MPEEKTLLKASLCLLKKGNTVMLMKKLKKVGAGCWNGPGGGLEPGETMIQCVVRETAEETNSEKRADAGIQLDQTYIADRKVAIIDFHNTKTDGTQFVCQVHVYMTDKWDGVAESTDELADPTWFDFDKLPLDEMMPADRVWLPYILEGKKITASAWYGPFQKEMLKPMKIAVVETLPD